MSRSLIVHVGNYDLDALDGVSTTLVGQCNALYKSGALVEVWSFRSDVTEVSSHKMPNGITVHWLPRFRNSLLAAMILPAVTKSWLASKLPSVRIFHLHSVFSPHNNRIAAFGVPYCITPNGGWGPSVIQGRRSLMKRIWINLFEKKLWDRAVFIQAVSRNEEMDLRALGLEQRTVFIPNGTEIFPIPNRVETKERQWLFLGRLAVEQKGLDILLQGYAKAKLTGVKLPRLILAGPDFRGGLDKLLSLAKELGIDDDVEFRGPVTGAAKERLWNSSELFIHTSRWEGLPLAILEALGHGVPCLVTPETGFADWLDSNQCGWKVKADSAFIADMMVLLATNSDEILLRAGCAQSAVQRDYSWSAIGAKLNGKYLMYLK